MTSFAVKTSWLPLPRGQSPRNARSHSSGSHLLPAVLRPDAAILFGIFPAQPPSQNLLLQPSGEECKKRTRLLSPLP